MGRMSDGRTTRGGDNPSRKGYGFFGARTRGVQDDAVGSTPRFKRGRDRGVDAATRRTTIISAERSRSGRDRGRIDRAAGAGWMAFFRKRRARGSPIDRFRRADAPCCARLGTPPPPASTRNPGASAATLAFRSVSFGGKVSGCVRSGEGCDGQPSALDRFRARRREKHKQNAREEKKNRVRVQPSRATFARTYMC